MSDSRLEALRLAAEEGFGRAGRGLSEMAGTDIEVEAPRLGFLPVGEVPGLIGGPDVAVVAVHLGIKGEVEGHMLLMLPMQHACALADLLLEQPAGSTTRFDEGLAASAIAEAGNITGSFFVGALADGTSLRMSVTPPAVVADMAGAILDGVLADLCMESEEVLVVETVFTQEQNRVDALFLVLPRGSYLDVLLGSLS